MRTGMRKKPHGAEYKFRVAVEAIRGDKTTAELCQEYGITSSQLFIWKKALLANGSQIFAKSTPAQSAHEGEFDKLHVTIGRLKVENDFLSKVLGKSQ